MSKPHFLFCIFQSNKEKREDQEEDFKKKMTKGAILVLSDVPKDVRRDAIKEQFNKYGTCSWVDLDEEAAEVCGHKNRVTQNCSNQLCIWKVAL